MAGSINEDLRACELAGDDVELDVAAPDLLPSGASAASPVDLDGDAVASNPANTTGRGRKPPKKRPRTSKCWKELEELTRMENGKKVTYAARCNYCKSQLSATSGGGTGHLNRHVKSCRKKALVSTCTTQSQLHLSTDGTVKS